MTPDDYVAAFAFAWVCMFFAVLAVEVVSAIFGGDDDVPK